MIDAILLGLLLVSLVKPDVLLSKKVKDKATEEQKAFLAKNYRKVYGLLIATIESLALSMYIGPVGCILALVCAVLFFVIAWPASKENRKLVKEIVSTEAQREEIIDEETNDSAVSRN